MMNSRKNLSSKPNQAVVSEKTAKATSQTHQQTSRDSEDRWQLVLRANNDGIWDWNLENQELFFSARWKEMLGYQDRELINHIDTWKSLLHPDDVERVMDVLQAYLEKRISHYNVEFRLRCKDSSYKWILSRGQALWDKAGKPKRMAGSHTDISDRKQEQILLRSLIDCIPDVIFSKNQDGAYLACNNAFEEFVGRKATEIIGLTDFELFPETVATFFREQDRFVMEQATSRCNEEWVNYPDGQRRLLDTLKTPYFSDDGKLLGLIGIGRDITERKQREAALQLIVEGTAAKTGREFFRSCVRYLAQVLQVRYALVTEFANPEKTKVRTLAFWQGEDFGSNFEYDLTFTENDPTDEGTNCYYTQSTQALFRNNPNLLQLEAQSYLEIPLVDNLGNGLGYLAVLDVKPIVKDASQELMLKIFAARAGAELKRQQAEEALRNRENRLRSQQFGLIELAKRKEFYRGNLNAALQVLTEKAATTLDVERVSVWFYDEVQTKICLRDLYQLSKQQHSSGMDLFAKDYPSYFQALENDEIIAVHQAQKDPRTLEFLTTWLIPLGITSMLDVPIRSGGKTVGVLCHEHVGSPRYWTLEEQNFANYLAYMASLAIEARDRVLAEAALQYRAETDSLLSKISHTLLDQDLDNAINFTLQALGQFTQSDRTQIIRYSDCQSQWSMIYEWCNTDIEPLIAQSQAVLIKKFPWISQQLLTGKPVKISQLNELPPDAIAERNAFSKGPIRSFLIVPMLNATKTVGYLGLDVVRTDKTWTQEEINLVKLVGELIAIAQARHDAEASLKRAKEDADAANRAKSEFLASMSHELRTPLNAILGFTQVINRDPSLNTEQQQNLNIISRSGEHLLALINDILEMSKIEAGRTTFNQNSFDLYRLLDSLEAMLRLKANAKNLQLIFERTPDVPQYIQTDEGKLRQVLLNLLGNALKFTEEGGVILRVRLGNRSQKSEVRSQESEVRSYSPHPLISPCPPSPEGAPCPPHPLCPSAPLPLCSSAPLLPHTLKFEVEDTGPGIASEEVNQLFEAFGQTETGRKSQQGTGLGLPISQKFIQLMGGDICVSSILGSGSLFSFEIPVNLATVTEIPKTQSRRRVISLAPDQPKYRILAVDDRLESRLLLVKLLSSIGFSVREAANGKEAIEIWENWSPHLIWMDMRMPIMDGYEATKIIKATIKGQATVIIALTASAFEEERTVILSAGCDDFIRKPFREEILWEKMAQQLGVRYLYEDDGQSKEEGIQPSTFNLQPSTLQVMPIEWIKQLHQAAIECSDDLLLELIEQIPADYPSLVLALTDLANNFLFEQITALTQPLAFND